LHGSPDIVLPKYGVAIFVHGCFWHQHQGCKYAKTPSSNAQFWTDKLNGNRKRDQQNIVHLLRAGWRVLLVWECAIRSKNGSELAKEMDSWIRSSERFRELPVRERVHVR
jgi:DNA mismatch endonuclease (patch repair protein)